MDQLGCQIAAEFVRREQQCPVQQLLVAALSSVRPPLRPGIGDDGQVNYVKHGSTWLRQIAAET
jgi:hypothetical protein